jgi:hypothetical protein
VDNADDQPIPAQKMAYSVTMTGKPLLEYGVPKSESGIPRDLRILARLAVRIVFAAAAVLFATGLSRALHASGDPTLFMQCGAGVMAFTAPLGWGRLFRGREK